MPYYPKNRIQTNLYTNGDEFVIKSNQSPYEGYYYKLYNGEIYTGKNPNDGNPKLLIPSTEVNLDKVNNSLYNTEAEEITISNIEYSNLRPKTSLTKKLPTPYYPQPTEQDYNLGEITRYFAKKINEASFIEISKSDYKNFKSHNDEYFWVLYDVALTPWEISGLENKVVNTNRDLVTLVEIKSKWPGFIKYITLNGGFNKFYK